MGRKTAKVKDQVGRDEAGGRSETDEIGAILRERGSTHGDFVTQAWVAQELKACAENGPNWVLMKANQREAIHMILHKISRVVCGNPDFKDTWDDIQGYARLISDKLTD